MGAATQLAVCSLTASVFSKPAGPALLCCAAPAGTGYLITPQHTNSYDEQALGRYTHINAFLNASQLCAAVDTVLATPFTVRFLVSNCFLHSSQPVYCGLGIVSLTAGCAHWKAGLLAPCSSSSPSALVCWWRYEQPRCCQHHQRSLPRRRQRRSVACRCAGLTVDSRVHARLAGPQEIEKKGQLARQEYMQGNAVFLARLQVRVWAVGH